MNPLAGWLALLSAAAFAGSTSLQHQAAGRTPSTTTGPLNLMGHLVRQPLWLLGQLLAVTGLALHATALYHGSIAAVQPIVISGVVLAVPIRSALSRRRPQPLELAAVAVVAVGLTVFLITSHPSGGTDLPKTAVALVICAAATLAAGCAMLFSRKLRDPKHAAFLLGAASGVLFGVVAGLMKATAYAAGHGGLTNLLTSWPTWALVVLGCVAVVTNQQAYRFARLSASMPVLNVVNGLVSLGFGVVAFHETLRHTPILVCLQILACTAISAGLLIIARTEDDEWPGPPEAQPAIQAPAGDRIAPPARNAPRVKTSPRQSSR